MCKTLESFDSGSSPKTDPKIINQKIQPKMDKIIEASNEGQKMRQKETLTVDVDIEYTLEQIYIQKKSHSNFNDVSYLYFIKRSKSYLNGKSGKKRFQ